MFSKLLKINVRGGERGIRTPGPVTVNGFQDRRNRPLCQLSAAKLQKIFELTKFFLKNSHFFCIFAVCIH